jgi:hypothetical protein
MEPFFKYTNKREKIVVHDIYGGIHTYSSLPIFKSEEWWNSQPWWVAYKQTLQVSSPPPPRVESPYSAPPLPTAPATIESLQAEITRLKNVIDKYKNLLIENRIPLPDVPI